MREARYIRGNGSTKLRHKRWHSVSLIIELAACKALANTDQQALREIQALPLQNNHLLRYLSTSLSTQLDQEKSRRQEKQPSADDLGSPLVACRNPCVVALKKPEMCRNDSPPSLRLAEAQPKAGVVG